MTIMAQPPQDKIKNAIYLSNEIEPPQSKYAIGKFETFIIVMVVIIVLLYTTHIIITSYALKIPDLCLLDKEAGNCRGYFESYYFDSKSGECKKFIFGGCGGNENRFENESECLNKCSGSFNYGPALKFN